MALSTIRTQLKTLIETVTGIGKVYDHEKFSADLKTRDDTFIKSGVLNVWDMRIIGIPEYTVTGSNAVEYNKWQFQIRGRYAYNDSEDSDITVANLVKSICELFRGRATIDNTANRWIPPIVAEWSNKMQFCGVLCHDIGINIVIEERTVF